jgi:hypothetical protein
MSVCWRDLGYLQYTRIEVLAPWCPSFRPHNDRADIVTRRVLFRVDANINLKEGVPWSLIVLSRTSPLWASVYIQT